MFTILDSVKSGNRKVTTTQIIILKLFIEYVTRRTKSSVKTNSGENSPHTSPRNRPYNMDYPLKRFRSEKCAT